MECAQCFEVREATFLWHTIIELYCAIIDTILQKQICVSKATMVPGGQSRNSAVTQRTSKSMNCLVKEQKNVLNFKFQSLYLGFRSPCYFSKIMLGSKSVCCTGEQVYPCGAVGYWSSWIPFGAEVSQWGWAGLTISCSPGRGCFLFLAAHSHHWLWMDCTACLGKPMEMYK